MLKIFILFVLLLVSYPHPEDNNRQIYVIPDKVELKNSDTFSIKSNIRNIEIKFIVSKDTTEILNFIGSYDYFYTKKRLSESAGATFYEDNNRNYPIIVWLSGYYFDVIIHELEHANYIIMKKAGYKYNDETMEDYAYHMDYISSIAYIKLIQNSNKNDKR